MDLQVNTVNTNLSAMRNSEVHPKTMGTKMKTLFVSFYNTEAYGIRQLHSKLVKEDIDAYMMFFKTTENKNRGDDYEFQIKQSFNNVVNEVTDKEFELLISFIKEFKPRIVAFSLYSSNFHLYKKVYSKIKNIKDLTVVLGGWQPTLNPDDSILYTDYMCIGEGYRALSELIYNLSKGLPTNKIDDIWVNDNNVITKNKTSALTQDSVNNPNALFDNKYCFVIEDNKILSKEPYFENTRYGTFISYGCPFTCTYCSNVHIVNGIYGKAWKILRNRTTEHVISELKLVKRKLKKVNRINFYDEIFLAKTDVLEEFSVIYKKEINLPFFVEVYPGSMREDKVKLLAEMGLGGVWMGIQSGSERIRKELYQRNTPNEKIMKQASIFKKYNIGVRYDFIFDNPYESFEESLESIYMMLQLPEPYSLNVYSLRYFPNCDLTTKAINDGVIEKENLDDMLELDYAYYGPTKNTKQSVPSSARNINSQFINRMAIYLALQANKGLVKKNKDTVIGLINDFKTSNNLSKIDKLLGI